MLSTLHCFGDRVTLDAAWCGLAGVDHTDIQREWAMVRAASLRGSRLKKSSLFVIAEGYITVRRAEGIIWRCESCEAGSWAELAPCWCHHRRTKLCGSGLLAPCLEKVKFGHPMFLAVRPEGVRWGLTLQKHGKHTRVVRDAPCDGYPFHAGDLLHLDLEVAVGLFRSQTLLACRISRSRRRVFNRRCGPCQSPLSGSLEFPLWIEPCT